MIFRMVERIRGYLMPFPYWRSSLGDIGEYLARRYYHRKGFHLIERNWTCGRGEIDLIMADGRRILFVEVKTRSKKPDRGISDVLGWDQEIRLLTMARAYLAGAGLSSVPWDLELVMIVLRRGKIKTLQTANIRGRRF